jgi:hypothetical protein
MYRNQILFDKAIQERLAKGMEVWSEQERNSKRDDDKLRRDLSELTQFLIKHDAYLDTYEPHYLEVMQEYYYAESKRMAETMKDDPKKFVAYLEARLEEEDNRCFSVMSMGTQEKAVNLARAAILKDRLNWLASTGQLTGCYHCLLTD